MQISAFQQVCTSFKKDSYNQMQAQAPIPTPEPSTPHPTLSLSPSTFSLLLDTLPEVSPCSSSPHKFFTLSEDLFIISQFHIPNQLVNARAISKKVAEELGRSEESVRERYRKKLVRLNEDQVRKMIGELGEGRDGCCEWGKDGGLEVVPVEGGKKRKIIKKETPVKEKKPPKVKESKYKALQCLVNYDNTKAHEFYRQPSDIINIVRQIAQVTKLNEVQAFQKLNKCSMNVETFYSVLQNPQNENLILWSAQQDKELARIWQEGDEMALDIMKKYKGQRNVDVRIQWMGLKK